MEPTICLDFDGVLNTYSGWKGEDELFEPRSHVGDFISTLKNLGYRVVVHSTRPANKISDWFNKWNLEPPHAVQNFKPPALCYLDDRAILFNGSFEDALEAIKNFKAFWEK